MATAGERTVEGVEGIISEVRYGGRTGGVCVGGTLRIKFMLVLDADSAREDGADGVLS